MRQKPKDAEDTRLGDKDDSPEDKPGEPGAEGGSRSRAKDKMPGTPADDDSPVGDTDQHSTG
jgi:hypothetical protein